MYATLPLLLALAAPAAPQDDRLELSSGESIVAEVLEASLDEIEYRDHRGDERAVPAREVLSIRYGPLPEYLQQAEGFREELDYQNALNSYDAAEREGGPWWVRPMAQLGRAQTLLAWSAIDPAKASDAETAFQDWLAKHPNSYHSIDARIGRARSLARQDRIDEGAQQMEQLASDAFQADLGPHVEHRAQLVRCQILLRGNRAGVAETRLSDLEAKISEDMRSSDSGAGTKDFLRGLHARCQIALGDAKVAKDGPQGARRYWEGLSREPGASSDVRAAALIGLAQAARAEGDAREAQLNLAKVVAVLRVRDDEVMARALFTLGEITEDLDNTPTPARDYFQRIVDEFPNTSWAVQARSKLN